MEPSKEAIAVRLARLNRLIIGKAAGVNRNNNLRKKIDREALLDALTVLYDDCNDDPLKKGDELVRAFVDKYRSTLAELRRTRVCLADFNLLQLIGRGHFGEVHMVREKESCDVYALKTLRKEAVAKQGAACVDEERDILASAATPWIPKLHFAFQDNSNLYLVMELCLGGDLAVLLSRRSQPLSERDAAFYIAEIAEALKALHSMGYVHRDIKPHNILIDRCGHIKLGDFGSCARLSEGGNSSFPVGTADYVAPELLAVADCAVRHSACLDCCRKINNYSLSACDYWSLGVVAFELVTLKRPFSTGDDDSIAQTLANIQSYERSPGAGPPWAAALGGRSPAAAWAGLVAGLLQVSPARRFTYLDTMQHPALQHLAAATLRDMVPPWVPLARGPEDAAHFPAVPRAPAPLPTAPFRARAPFAGQLPYLGFSYVAPEENEESMASFNSTSHDCTAIDLATFKSAEKLAATRAKEIASLQKRLAEAESLANTELERMRRANDAEAETTRAKLQAEITALSLQNKRLERQLEVEKEERVSLERGRAEAEAARGRSAGDLRRAHDRAAEGEAERDLLREQVRRLEKKVSELQADCERAQSAADDANAQQRHFKESMAKERAIRRQTITDMSSESREAASRLAAAAASVAKEARAREEAEQRLAAAEAAGITLQAELEDARRQLARIQETSNDSRRVAQCSSEELKQVQDQLTQERVRASTLQAQVQELQRSLSEASRREAALEEQFSRTQARLQERAAQAEERANHVQRDDQRHREKVHSLEQLVRQLEREVNALETRNDAGCKKESASDTESVGENETASSSQLSLLKQQLERAEAQLQARTEEIVLLKQETRTANLARWRKEREFNDLQTESKTLTRDLKRLEERLAHAHDARKETEQKLSALETELAELRPKYESCSQQLERLKEKYDKVAKVYEVQQVEVDRSRNDILKLKSELQYSEKRRIRAERQEELASQERAQLRDEVTQLRANTQLLETNNKALQEACSLLEDQLDDLEKLADLNDVKNADLEKEVSRLREEVSACRDRLAASERSATEMCVTAELAARREHDASELASAAQAQILQLTERIETLVSRISTLESALAEAESEAARARAALGGTSQRLADLQEDNSQLRTRAAAAQRQVCSLQADLHAAQEEAAATREAAAGAAAWWRTRETKAEATLRQQAKLIDFLQVKVEEANRKKCSLSTKLFGRSGRRPVTASPPLRRANKELRTEVDRLLTKLSESAPVTPISEKVKPTFTPLTNGAKKSIDTPDGLKSSPEKNSYQVEIIWSETLRAQAVVARVTAGALQCVVAGDSLQARLAPAAPAADTLPPADRERAFPIVIENESSHAVGSCAVVLCTSVAERRSLTARLQPSTRYLAHAALVLRARPNAALHLEPHLMAIGTEEGLRSLCGAVRLEGLGVPAGAAVSALAVAGGRAVLQVGAQLGHVALAALTSALRRAPALRPALTLQPLTLPCDAAPTLIQSAFEEEEEESEEGCARLAVACGRRVFVVSWEAASGTFRVQRSATADRAPAALLLLARALLLAGARPLRLPLQPAGALEPFAAAACPSPADRHDAPRALLPVRRRPLELLLCYARRGVFVDERGRRTRTEDAAWDADVHTFRFVRPFLYLLAEDRVTVVHVTDDSFQAPPCTCDDHSVASTPSETGAPQVTLRLREPALLAAAPNGIVVRTRALSEYSVAVVEGLAAFRSVGASVDSVDTVSDGRGSSTDLAHSSSDCRDDSVESIVPNTGFLADIREQARQLRLKNRKQEPADEVIKEILLSEIGARRPTGLRAGSPSTSEFTSDSENEPPPAHNHADSTKTPADLCAEMFTRQVRFE